MSIVKDFTPTKETISLHGLGFIQLKLENDQRLHVWHPDLPRRRCYEASSIHNHRFAFTSRVLIGEQCNQRVELEFVRPGTGTHRLISHNGPRSAKGDRESYPVADVNVYTGEVERYVAGQMYSMNALAYHRTLCTGIVVTLMQKTETLNIHANSVCHRDTEFDYDFDRFQLSVDELFDIVKAAFFHVL